MIVFSKRARTQSKLNKCRIELGGVQAEFNILDQIIKAKQSITFSQTEDLQKKCRRIGELRVEISILEHELANPI